LTFRILWAAVAMSLLGRVGYADGAEKIDGLSAASHARGISTPNDLGSQLYRRGAIAPSRSEAASLGSAAIGSVALGLVVTPSNSTKAGLVYEILNQDRAVMGDLEFTVSGGGAFGSYDDFYTAGVIEALPDLAAALDSDESAFTAGSGAGAGKEWVRTISVAAASEPVAAPEPRALMPYVSALLLLGLLRWQALRKARQRVSPPSSAKA